jgi:hypothetical protein
VPYALGGTALLVIRQFAAMKLDFQHFAECCPSVQWDESENVVGYAGAGGCCAAGMPSHSGIRSNIRLMLVPIDVGISLRGGSRIFAKPPIIGFLNDDQARPPVFIPSIGLVYFRLLIDKIDNFRWRAATAASSRLTAGFGHV